jgi:hypothetical protein
LLLVAVAAAAGAGQPPPPPPTGAQPEDSFIEFLGADDVGDARWWEFLKHAEPQAEDPPPPPSQDAKR